MIDLKQCSLGIELGSTRIKAVLVGDTCKPVAQGDFTWENRLENGGRSCGGGCKGRRTGTKSFCPCRMCF